MQTNHANIATNLASITELQSEVAYIQVVQDQFFSCLVTLRQISHFCCFQPKFQQQEHTARER